MHQIVVTDPVTRMIRQSGLKIIPFDDLDEAAHNAVKLAI